VAGVGINEDVFGMDAKASPHGWVHGDLSDINPCYGLADSQTVLVILKQSPPYKLIIFISLYGG